MAKRTEKKATATAPDAASKPFQIPEVTSTPPEPWETIAASVPKLPPNDDVTAHAVPVQKAKPTLPSGIYDFDPDAVQRDKASVLPPAMAISRPARGRVNLLGTDLLGDCAMANKLGTRQPVKVYVTFSDDRRWLFLMPVDSEATKALEVSYRKKVASINLWKPLQRSVEKGYNEIYALDMTDTPITAHGVKGYALYIDLAHPDTQPIQERDESAPAAEVPGKTKATKKTSAATSAPGKADGATTPTSTDPAEEIRRLNKSIDERDEMLDERDTEIDELLKRLHAYEEKYGRLES